MKKLLIILSFIFFICNFLTSGDKDLVTIILSSKVESYQNSSIGIKRYISSNNLPVVFKEYFLDEQDEGEILKWIEETKPKVICAVGSKAAKLAKYNIKDIPVVFNLVLNVNEFVKDNMRGFSIRVPLDEKFKVIKKVLPKVKKVGVIYSNKSIDEYNIIVSEAKDYNIEIVAKQIGTTQEFANAVQEIFPKIDCFLMVADSEVFFPYSIKFLLTHSLEMKVPVIGLSSVYTKAGCLFSLENDYTEIGYKTGEVVAELLKGQTISDIKLPSQLTNFHLSLNLRVAEVLGINIPKEVIEKAQEVIR